MAVVITVGIVDDHPLYRAGLAGAVEQMPDLDLLAQAVSIEDFDAQGAGPDVVLLDLHLPGLHGAEGVAHVVGGGHRVIVVSATGDADDVIDAIAAGARGYLTKDATAEDIAGAVRAVAQGMMYVSPTLAGFLLRAERQPSLEEHYRLSPREMEILALVASGETDRDIAAELHLSVATVYSHLDRIRDKTGARRRAQLTRLYLDNQDRSGR